MTLAEKIAELKELRSSLQPFPLVTTSTSADRAAFDDYNYQLRKDAPAIIEELEAELHSYRNPVRRTVPQITLADILEDDDG